MRILNIFLVTALAPLLAQESDPSGAFIGLKLGVADYQDFYSECDDCGFLDSFRTDLIEIGFAQGLFGGYRFNRYFSLEGGLHHFGKSTQEFDFDPEGGFDDGLETTLRINSIAAHAVGSIPLNSWLEANARVGWHFYEMDTKTQENEDGFIETFKEDNTDTDLTYGLGLQAKISRRLALRLAWEDYKIDTAKFFPDGEGSFKFDLNTYTVALSYHF